MVNQGLKIVSLLLGIAVVVVVIILIAKHHKDKYTSAANISWHSVTSMPHARFGHAMVSTNGKVYTIGGFTKNYKKNGNTHATNLCFDPTKKPANQWTVIPQLNFKPCLWLAAAIWPATWGMWYRNTTIYALGGLDAEGKALKSVQTLTLPPYKYPNDSNYKAKCLGTCVGGTNCVQYNTQKTCTAAKPLCTWTQEWQKGVDMTTARVAAAAATIPPHIIYTIPARWFTIPARWFSDRIRWLLGAVFRGPRSLRLH